MAKEAYLYGKRGLLVWQKRPVHIYTDTLHTGPMWMGGHWHAYATPNNQEVEICYKVERLDEVALLRWSNLNLRQTKPIRYA